MHDHARDRNLPFEIRRSPIEGLGAFATQPIPAGVRLIEYAGERLTPSDAEARYPDVRGERHHTYLFAIDDDVVVDAAVNGNDARFINHSCAPNCDAVIEDGRIWIGFSRLRATKFRDNVSWVVKGFKKILPTRVACYDLERRSLLSTVDVEPYGMNAVFSVLPVRG